MRGLTIGRLRVDAVVETAGPTRPTWLFPDATAEGLERHRAWLAPHFLDAAGRLLQSVHTFVVRAPDLTLLVVNMAHTSIRDVTAVAAHLRSTGRGGLSVVAANFSRPAPFPIQPEKIVSSVPPATSVPATGRPRPAGTGTVTA